jgi:hypothetical protein
MLFMIGVVFYGLWLGFEKQRSAGERGAVELAPVVNWRSAALHQNRNLPLPLNLCL